MRVLMCKPEFFRIQAENQKANPWMKKDNQPNKYISLRQWHGLKRTLANLKVVIDLIRPANSFGDMCFAANAAWGRKGNFFTTNFSPHMADWRIGEIPLYKSWLDNHGFKTYMLPKDVYFEGQSDIIHIGDGLHFFGLTLRNSPQAAEYIASCFTEFGEKTEIITVKIADDRFYHFDMPLHYARELGALLWCPDAFDAESQIKIERVVNEKKLKGLRLRTEEVIQSCEDGRVNFLLNAIDAGRNEIMGWDKKHSAFPDKVEKFIRDLGGKIYPVNMSEFGLSGGGARCLTLFLD